MYLSDTAILVTELHCVTTFVDVVCLTRKDMTSLDHNICLFWVHLNKFYDPQQSSHHTHKMSKIPQV